MNYPYFYQQNYQQQNSFVHVQSENEARMYPVAYGGSVTFIDDNAPYCYTKTAGFSQFDTPTFKKFRLVEETPTDERKGPTEAQTVSSPDVIPDVIKAQIDALTARIEALENRKENDNEPVEHKTKSRSNVSASQK